MVIELEQGDVTLPFWQAIQNAIQAASAWLADEQRDLAGSALENMSEWEETPKFRVCLEEARAQMAAGDWMTLEKCVQLQGNTFTPKLRQAFALAFALPEAQQRKLALSMWEEIKDIQWEEAPEFHAFLEKVRAEYAAGDCMDFEEFVRQRQTESP